MSAKPADTIDKERLLSNKQSSADPGYMGLTQYSLQELKFKQLATGNVFRRRLIQIPTQTQIADARARIVGHSTISRWLFSFNRAGHEMNLTIVLSQLLWLALVVTLYFIAQGINPRILVIPMWLDIAVQLITLHLYQAYPAEFSGGGSLQATDEEIRCQEITSIFKKVVLSLLLTFPQNQASTWYILVAIIFGLVFLGTEYFHKYLRAYHTVFTFTNSVTLSLFLINYYGWQSLKASWIIFFVDVWAWILVGVSGLLLLYSVWKLLVLLFNSYLRLIPIQISYVFLAANIFFFLGNAHLALSCWVQNKTAILKIDLSTSCLILFLVQTGNFFYILWAGDLSDQLHDQFRNFLIHGTPRTLGMSSDPQSTHFLTILRPLLLHQAVPLKSAELDVGRLLLEELCVFCLRNKSSCVIITCFHTGVCKECARNRLADLYMCPFCTLPMHKIVAVAAKGIRDCEVTEEAVIFDD